jgi:ABC-2 type transport system ATP-binding protein
MPALRLFWFGYGDKRAGDFYMVETDEFLLVEGMTAGYGGQAIVTEINLELKAGDILGLLGANGSGKSTLLKAVTGQIRPMRGTVRIAGTDIEHEPEHAKAKFGLAIDSSDLPAPLTGRQYLTLVASIRGCREDEWPCEDVIGRLCLAAWMDRRIAEYSLGTKAKIAIAAALLGAPALLIFDESLNGLDPVAGWEVKTMLSELAATRKHAIIVSTHVVEMVPTLCNRATFLADGRIVRSWDWAELKDASPTPGAFENCVIHALKMFGRLPVPA